VIFRVYVNLPEGNPYIHHIVSCEKIDFLTSQWDIFHWKGPAGGLLGPLSSFLGVSKTPRFQVAFKDDFSSRNVPGLVN
jgi:hypothetical protein